MIEPWPSIESQQAEHTVDLTEPVVDLTATGPIAEAAQAAVDELQAEFGGGPWYVGGVEGAVIAASGPVTDGPTTPVPWGAPGLELRVAAPRSGSGSPQADDERCMAGAARLGSLLTAVIAAHGRAALAEARAAAAERRATRDALTGLADQGEWWRRISELEDQLARHPRPTVIAVIDLDGLKVANDTHGHLHGDLLIKLAARALTSAVRGGDLVARIGGDEFAVLAVDHDADAAILRRRLSNALTEASVAASVGAAHYRAHANLQDTFAAADKGMYQAKSARRRQNRDRRKSTTTRQRPRRGRTPRDG